MTSNRTTFLVLAGLTSVAVFLCFLLVAPFLKPIVFAAVLAIIFNPMYVRMLQWTRNRNVAAALSTALVILSISIVSFFLGRTIASELRDVYLSLRGTDGAKERLSLFLVHAIGHAAGFIGGLVPGSATHLQIALSNQVENMIAGLIATSAGMFGSIVSLFLSALICFFVLFFLFRDGKSMLRRTAAVLPLKPSQVASLNACVKETLGAILYGTLVIALTQGALAGIAFYFLGFASPVLWGIVTSLCALLPAIGTAFVFLPALLMLAFGSHWIKAVILLLWALAVVHPIDNILRPYLIGGRVRLSTLYVFLSLLGGLKAFGAVGLFVGPLILAVTVALFRLLREEKRASRGKPFTEILADKKEERAIVS